MHNKFKRFTFFGSRNSREELNERVDDKIVKYLYKKDSKTKDHKKKPRNTSTHHEEKQHKKHRKESSDRRTDKKTLPPTEEVKKHKKSHNKDKPSISDHKTKHEENGKSKSVSHNKQNKYEELVKLIKDNKHLKEKLLNSNKDDKWLTKKDIVTLLSHVKYLPKDASISPSLLKKFFTFDKKASDQKSIRDDSKHPKKANRQKDNNTVVSSHDKKQEKASKRSEKKSKERSEETRKSTNKDNRHHQNKTKVIEIPLEKKHHKKKSSVKNEEERQRNVHISKSSVHDIENFKNVQQEIVRLVQAVQNARAKEYITRKECDLSDNVKTEQTAKTKTRKEDSEQNEQKMNRVNPVRHKLCLVKNTFSIVEIPSTFKSSVDRKKKTKVFKRYYKYDNYDTEREIKSETYQTNSDSNKLYEEPSDDQKCHTDKVKKAKDDSEKILKSETHVVSVVIVPEDTKTNQDKDNKKEISNKSSLKGSKIPILSSPIKKSSLKVRKVEETASDEILETFTKNDHKMKKKSDKILSLETVKENPPKMKAESVKFSKRYSSSVKSSKTATEEVVRVKSANNQRGSRTKNSEIKKKPINKRVEEEESNFSNTSNVSKLLKQSDRTKNQRRKLSATSSKISTDSSLLSRRNKRLNKTSLASNSDTKVHQSKKDAAEKRMKKFERSSTNASFSNSTVKSDSTGKTTSFFLTKTYRDDDKLSRMQKSKMYADHVRRNLINKKAPVIPPQVMEVRYLTVTNEVGSLMDQISTEITAPTSPVQEKYQDFALADVEDSTSPVQEKYQDFALEEVEDPTSPVQENEDFAVVEVEEINVIEKETTIMEFFMNDLPQPCMEVVNPENFNELFQLPTDEALNEILNENYNFLQKDFSYKFDSHNSSSTDILSCTEVILRHEKISEDWFDDETLSDVSCYNKFESENFGKLVDSYSVPGSEESGYSTLESRPVSSNFFNRPEIKALFYPPTTLDSYFLQMETDKSSSSLEIRSIESKSLQTVIECSQKSVQIKLSQEEMPEMLLSGEDTEPEIKKTKAKRRRLFMSWITCLNGE